MNRAGIMEAGRDHSSAGIMEGEGGRWAGVERMQLMQLPLRVREHNAMQLDG